MNNDLVIADILEHNASFVAEDKGSSFRAEVKPRKQLAIVTCMDTRLTTMFTAALGLKNGDANIITVAGATVGDAYGAVVRSLLVAVYELGVRDIMVVAHTECGAQHMNCTGMSALFKNAGISDESLRAVEAEGVSLHEWLEGFGELEGSVQKDVALLANHPLMPGYVNVHGFVIDTQTGELTVVA
ncbi:MAG: carbonic anhydrase [Coriobacteriia bacterium]|nr:carbonic anhydrase [Coriobacteriia bacterium]